MKASSVVIATLAFLGVVRSSGATFGQDYDPGELQEVIEPSYVELPGLGITDLELVTEATVEVSTDSPGSDELGSVPELSALVATQVQLTAIEMGEVDESAWLDLWDEARESGQRAILLRHVPVSLGYDVVRPLEYALRDEDSRVRSAAILAVPTRLEGNLFYSVRGLFSDPDAAVRTAAIHFVAGHLVDDSDAIWELISKAWDEAEDLSVRITALETVREFGREHPEVLEAYGIPSERLDEMKAYLWDLFGQQTSASPESSR